MKPQELVSHALELLLAQDMAAFAGLWAEDGVLEFPFAAPGYPAMVEGRAAVTEACLRLPRLRLRAGRAGQRG